MKCRECKQNEIEAENSNIQLCAPCRKKFKQRNANPYVSHSFQSKCSYCGIGEIGKMSRTKLCKKCKNLFWRKGWDTRNIGQYKTHDKSQEKPDVISEMVFMAIQGKVELPLVIKLSDTCTIKVEK